jgi:hypothetical protein
MKFNEIDDFIEFVVLDIITTLFYSKYKINQNRFIKTLELVLSEIKMCRDRENN